MNNNYYRIAIHGNPNAIQWYVLCTNMYTQNAFVNHVMVK